MSKLIPIDTERALISCILNDAEIVFPAIMDTINRDSFGVPAMRTIFDHCKALYIAKSPVDIVSVSQSLLDSDQIESIGGAVAITDISMATPSSANFRHYADIVKLSALRRQSIADLTSLTARTESGDDPPEQLAKEMAELAEKTRRVLNPSVEIVSAMDASKAFIAHMKEMRASGEIPGIPTGLDEFDQKIGGIKPGDVFVIGAYPSDGKTALGLQLVSSALDHGHTCAVFSMELPREKIISRLVCHRARIDNSYLTRPATITDPIMGRISAAINEISKMPLYIIDAGVQTATSIRANCQRIKDRHGLGLVDIDYIQLVRGESGKSESREQELSRIGKDFKAMAKDFKCGVLVQSQRNDDGKLKGARAIGEDADIVASIEKDGIRFDKVRDGERNWTLNATLDGAKQRFY